VPTTTLRIGLRQKRRFDRLKANLHLLTGQRMTQDEFVDWLLRQGERAPKALAGKRWRPLSAPEIEKAMALPLDLGVELGDVDRALYGKQGKSRV